MKNTAFKLRAPIQNHFMNRGQVCILTQLFGENKNRLFYGSRGHLGVDVATQKAFKWLRVGDMTNGKVGNVKQMTSSDMESQGFIPTVATHDGLLTTNIFQYHRRNGWYVKVTSDVMWENKEQVQYQTLHFHLEAFWRSLKTFKKGRNSLFKKETVKAGAIIGICGNTGKYTTGAHLHFELRRRKKVNGKWTAWEKIDPMPYLKQHDVVFQRYEMTGSQWFYKGKRVNKNPLKSPKIVV